MIYAARELILELSRSMLSFLALMLLSDTADEGHPHAPECCHVG
jgi:hypothetical protein